MKSPGYYQREAAQVDIETSTRPVVQAGLRIAAYVKACGFPRHQACAALRFAQAFLDGDFASSKSKDGQREDHRGEA